MKHLLPNWRKILVESHKFPRFLDSKELIMLVKKAEKDYDYWDNFKYKKMPEGITSEEAWAYLKFTRLSHAEKTPVIDPNGNLFMFSLTKSMYQKLSYIDTNTSGLLGTEWKPTSSQQNRLLLSGITEEAIASSQIEGANTSRKVAKEMILTKRKPRNHSEQMIINNFKLMQRLLELRQVDLSLELLLEFQATLTDGTLNDEQEAGRFRTDDDDIHVVDQLTKEIVYSPPKAKIMQRELTRLVTYANEISSSDDFVHPVIKACILHFWLAYLHPFVDGNGRTARALFYWYLLRNNYWLFQYLSVSRIIKQSKISYDNSFIYSEKDDNDMSYFISYNLKAILKAIEDFIQYYKRKVSEEEKLSLLTSKMANFNYRQISLLLYASNNPNEILSIGQHQAKSNTSYETARTDLMFLENQGYLTTMTKGKKFVYVPNIYKIRKLMETLGIK